MVTGVLMTLDDITRDKMWHWHWHKWRYSSSGGNVALASVRQNTGGRHSTAVAITVSKPKEATPERLMRFTRLCESVAPWVFIGPRSPSRRSCQYLMIRRVTGRVNTTRQMASITKTSHLPWAKYFIPPKKFLLDEWQDTDT